MAKSGFETGSSKFMGKLGIVLKSFIYNLLVVVINFGAFYVIAKADSVLGFRAFQSEIIFGLGAAIVFLGWLVRFWASLHFYKSHMAVLAVKPQDVIVTSGPFKYSRNPLFIGIVLIMLGSALVFDTIIGIILTLLSAVLLNYWAGTEEKQLEEIFGQEYLDYKQKTRRWI